MEITWEADAARKSWCSFTKAACFRIACIAATLYRRKLSRRKGASNFFQNLGFKPPALSQKQKAGVFHMALSKSTVFPHEFCSSQMEKNSFILKLFFNFKGRPLRCQPLVMPAGEHSLPSGPKLLSVPEAPFLGNHWEQLPATSIETAAWRCFHMFLLFKLRSEQYEDVFTYKIDM